MQSAHGQDDRPLASLSRLLGSAGLARLQASHVVVVGIGGVGSWAAEALARSGIGQLTLIDLDHISASNLNRQVHALQSTVGQSKVSAMQERLLAIQPGLIVNMIDDFVTPENWPALLAGTAVDAVVDCCDQFSAKWAMAQWALQQPKGGTLLVCVGAAGGKRRAQAVDVADLAHVTHDPLLAKLRYQMRRESNKSVKPAKAPPKLGVMCVYSAEPVEKPQGQTRQSGGAALNCAGYGSVVTVTAAFGMVAANCVLNHLAPAQLGRTSPQGQADVCSR